jgi:hypothetical protein
MQGRAIAHSYNSFLIFKLQNTVVKYGLPYISVFSVRVMNIPILSKENIKKYDFKVLNNDYSLSPYWKHSSMDCLEATTQARRMTKEIIKRKLCIDASLFYNEILDYNQSDKAELLELQYNALKKRKYISLIFSIIFFIVDFS